MTPLGFIRVWNGRRIDFPGGIGGQCVDLANQYVHDVAGRLPVRRNAGDWAGLALPGFHWIANSPFNAPELGALVVWHESVAVGVSIFGHIAVAVAADGMALVTFDQDWPVGVGAALTPHSYAGVVGWHALLP